MSIKGLELNKRYDLEQVASFLGIKRFHAHELVVPKDGVQRIPSIKQPHPKFPKIQRWMTLGSDIQKYADTRKAGVGKRLDGRNKYTIHLSPEELAKVEKFLATLPGTTIARANKPKA